MGRGDLERRREKEQTEVSRQQSGLAVSRWGLPWWRTGQPLPARCHPDRLPESHSPAVNLADSSNLVAWSRAASNLAFPSRAP